jgi:anti-sigma-K factor RskA
MTVNHQTDRAHDCDPIKELIPEYAFGLTDPTETRLVEANLADCPEASAQLADFRRLQAEMRAGVPQIEPSAHLGERLMAAIVTPPTPAKVRRFQPINRAWLAAAIAAIAVIALLGTNIYWLTRVDELSRRQNELAAQIAALQSGNGAFILASTSELRWVRLPPSEQNANAAAFLMWNGESKIGILYAHGLPKLAAGRSYQFWLTRGPDYVSAGTLKVDEEGKGALLFNIKEPIDKYTWARITTEPASGSDSPDGTVIVAGKLATP